MVQVDPLKHTRAYSPQFSAIRDSEYFDIGQTTSNKFKTLAHPCSLTQYLQVEKLVYS